MYILTKRVRENEFLCTCQKNVYTKTPFAIPIKKMCIQNKGFLYISN